MTDRSNGYEAIADRFLAARSDIGVEVVRDWARALPGAEAACEAVEDSRFFDRKFDAAVAIGLLFLLPETAQATLIARVGQLLHPGGRFLFSAPRTAGTWHDTLTGRTSRSMGEGAYRALMTAAGLHPIAFITDRGGNDHGMAVAATKRAA